MNKQPRHMILRLVTVYLLAFGGLTLALGEGTYLYSRHELDQNLDARLADRMAKLVSIHKSSGFDALAAAVIKYRNYGGHSINYRLIGPHGDAVVDIPEMPRLAPGWGRHMFRDDDEDRMDPARTLTEQMSDGSMLTIMSDRDVVEHFDHSTRAFVVSALALLAAVAAAGGFLLQRVTTRRIEALNATARDILNGKLDRRVPVSGRNDEMDAVAETVNVLLDRMNALLREMRRVSRYVAHDMRAPLVRLHEHLVELRGERAAIEPDRLESAVEVCEETIELFSAILRLGDIDPYLIAETGELFDMSELALDIVDAYTPVAQDRRHQLEAHIKRDLLIFGDRDLLTQVLVNLIENGLVHTPDGTSVTVELQDVADTIHMSVRDDGHGMSDDNRRRFLADNGMTSSELPYREALGLRLVETIVRAHKGTLDIQPNDPGLAILITLPKNL